jgi:ABC-2 type transport system permease protein
VQIPLPEDLTEEGLKRSMDAAFKRFATGYLSPVALMAPETGIHAGHGRRQSVLQLADTLMTDHNVERTQLTEGRVPKAPRCSSWPIHSNSTTSRFSRSISS